VYGEVDESLAVVKGFLKELEEQIPESHHDPSKANESKEETGREEEMMIIDNEQVTSQDEENKMNQTYIQEQNKSMLKDINQQDKSLIGGTTYSNMHRRDATFIAKRNTQPDEYKPTQLLKSRRTI